MKNAKEILFDIDNPYHLDLTNYEIHGIQTDSREVKQKIYLLQLKAIQ